MCKSFKEENQQRYYALEMLVELNKVFNDMKSRYATNYYKMWSLKVKNEIKRSDFKIKIFKSKY